MRNQYKVKVDGIVVAIGSSQTRVISRARKAHPNGALVVYRRRIDAGREWREISPQVK